MKRLLPLYAVAVYAFLHLPLLVLMVFSFNSSRYTVWEGFSLRWYQALAADTRLVSAAANSLWIALVSTAVATVLGTLCAHAMWKRRARLLGGSMYLSLVTPDIVTGVSMLAFFQYILPVLHLRLGFGSIVLAHVTFCLAFVVIVVQGRLRTLDPALEEAALDLGASEWDAFYRVTLPVLVPGVAAAALLAFTTSVDDYVITSLVAGVDTETLPMVIYSMARRGVSPSVNAISALIVTALGLLILAAGRLRTE